MVLANLAHPTREHRRISDPVRESNALEDNSLPKQESAKIAQPSREPAKMDFHASNQYALTDRDFFQAANAKIVNHILELCMTENNVDQISALLDKSS